MKRKLIALLTVALTVTLLGGCGKDSTTVTTNDSTGVGTNKKTDTSKKVDTLSEYLSKEKTICYKVSSMDKEEIPTAYFFEDGKMTIIQGDVLGLTLGELAQMEDKDIWNAYEKARISYKESYTSQQEKERQTSIKEFEKTIASLEKEYGANSTNVTTQVEGTDYNLKEMHEMLDILNGFVSIGPFYDIPFSFAITTDASGNIVKEEQLIYPRYFEKDSIHLPTLYYSSLKFDNTVEGGETQIYNTTYNCFPVSGNDVFCTRDSMALDTVNSKNVLIDPNDDKLNELYEEEVTSSIFQ